MLFGSHAHGDASLESDVDVFVVLSHSVDYVTEIRCTLDLKMDVLVRHGHVLALEPIDLETYQNEEHSLMMNVHGEGAHLA